MGFSISATILASSLIFSFVCMVWECIWHIKFIQLFASPVDEVRKPNESLSFALCSSCLVTLITTLLWLMRRSSERSEDLCFECSADWYARWISRLVVNWLNSIMLHDISVCVSLSLPFIPCNAALLSHRLTVGLFSFSVPLGQHANHSGRLCKLSHETFQLTWKTHLYSIQSAL